MSKKKEKAQQEELLPQVQPATQVAVVSDEVQVAKTKKELKEERKAIEKHKKEVRKEAERHSAKATKAQKVWYIILCVFVAICLATSAILVYKAYGNLGKTEQPTTSQTGDNSSSSSSSSTSTNTSSSNTSTSTDTSANTSAEANTDASSNGSETPAPSGELDPTNKASVVEYYKKAQANAVAKGKCTKVYENNTNYNQILDVGGNSTISGVAQKLMGMFLKENTEQKEATLPPKDGCSGLTPDMISEFSCKDNGDSWEIMLKIDSSEASPDLGDKTKNLCDIVNEADITGAVPAGLVTLNGVKNEYYGASVVATVEKSTGNLTHLETDVPTTMNFESVKAAVVITVEGCRIGLEYQNKFDIAY